MLAGSCCRIPTAHLVVRRSLRWPRIKGSSAGRPSYLIASLSQSRENFTVQILTTRQRYQYTEIHSFAFSSGYLIFLHIQHGISVLQGAEQGVHHLSTPSSEPLQCQAQPTFHLSSTTSASSLVCLDYLVYILVECQTTSKYRRYHRPAHRVSPSHPFRLPNSPPPHYCRDGQYGAYPLFDPNNRVAAPNPLPEFLTLRLSQTP